MLNRYSQALKIEGNSPVYVEHLDHTMRLFAKFVKKDMSEVITEDILDFLSKYRRDEELDPLHKGIGTYNQRLALPKFLLDGKDCSWTIRRSINYYQHQSPSPMS